MGRLKVTGMISGRVYAFVAGFDVSLCVQLLRKGIIFPNANPLFLPSNSTMFPTEIKLALNNSETL